MTGLYWTLGFWTGSWASRTRWIIFSVNHRKTCSIVKLKILPTSFTDFSWISIFEESVCMCMDLGAAAFCSFEGELESTSQLFRDAMVVAGASPPRPFPTYVRGLADFVTRHKLKGFQLTTIGPRIGFVDAIWGWSPVGGLIGRRPSLTASHGLQFSALIISIIILSVHFLMIPKARMIGSGFLSNT